MKKTYLIPALKVEEAQAAAQMLLAESLGINGDKTVGGDEALTKEDVLDFLDEE